MGTKRLTEEYTEIPEDFRHPALGYLQRLCDGVCLVTRKEQFAGTDGATEPVVDIPPITWLRGTLLLSEVFPSTIVSALESAGISHKDVEIEFWPFRSLGNGRHKFEIVVYVRVVEDPQESTPGVTAEIARSDG